MVNQFPDELASIYRTSLEAGTGLPAEAYTSAELYSWEIRRLFHRSWMCIGRERDAPEPGDIHPLRFAGLPLLMVRDHDGVLRVFHNVCPHRGSELAETPRNCRRNLVCPYHGWAFALSGKLARTPHAGGAGKHRFDGIDTEKARLSEVRRASWCGLVFVDISGQAVPFDEYIEPVLRRMGNLELEQPRHDADLTTEMTLQANWKLVVENFVESYHVPSVHPELEKMNPMKDHYQILGGFSYIGQGGEAYAAEQQEELSGLPLRKQIEARCYESLYIYPNLILGPLANFMFVIIIDPLSASETRERVECAFYTDEALTDELAQQRKSNADFLVSVNRQDIGICEKAQRGRLSPAFNGGLFALPQETTSVHFIKLVSAMMLAEKDIGPEQFVDLDIRDIHHHLPVA